jgi:hypothetical protein
MNSSLVRKYYIQILILNILNINIFAIANKCNLEKCNKNGKCFMVFENYYRKAY